MSPVVRDSGRLVAGVAVIALGALFLMDNAGLVHAFQVLLWSPLLLSVYGVARLAGRRRSVAAGLLLTFLGVWFTLGNLGLIHVSLWPIILILIGGVLVARSRGLQRSGRDQPGDPSPDLNAFALWSGTVRSVTARDFRGGEVTAVMGGHQIDFRQARMAGGTAVIELLVIMGGVEIRVPEDWSVSCDCLPILGGVENRAKSTPGGSGGHLTLNGLILMGGIEVKN
jgi:predicted membrane protein